MTRPRFNDPEVRALLQGLDVGHGASIAGASVRDNRASLPLADHELWICVERPQFCRPTRWQRLSHRVRDQICRWLGGSVRVLDFEVAGRTATFTKHEVMTIIKRR